MNKGGEIVEFSSDREFYSNYLQVRDNLIKQGWKENSPKRDKRTITTLFTKDGYGIYVLYGCEEEIKNEVF
jgi:hypothetical protein